MLFCSLMPNAHVGSVVRACRVRGVVQRIRTSMVRPFMMSSELSVSACLRLLRSSTLRCTRGLVTELAMHHRNYYIAILLEWAADTISSAVLEDIDTGATNVDHYPVSLVLESVASFCGQGVDLFHLDDSKLTNSACRKVFSDLLESVQPLPWNVDVDTHCRRLCKTLSDAACTAFAKKGDKPKQPYVTERTWHLVRFRKWLLKTIKVSGNPVVLLADVHSVMWQFVSSSFLKEPWCHTDLLFIELNVFAVWSFDACVVNYHPAWQVFCRSLAFAFPEVAEDAQPTMELLRNPLLSEHEQRVCNVRSALLVPHQVLANVGCHSGPVQTKLPSLRVSPEVLGRLTPLVHHARRGRRSSVSWRGEGKRGNLVHMRVSVLMVPLRSHLSKLPTLFKDILRQSSVQKFMSLEPIAPQHSCKPAIGTVVGVSVVVQKQIPQSQTGQKTVDVPFVRFIDRVVDVPATVQRLVPSIQKFQKTFSPLTG